MNNPNFTDEFQVVLNHELDQVAARRTAVLGESTPVSPCAACCAKDHLSEEETNKCVTCVRDRAKRMDLFGVSFSGGGIRSATFSLGILQALGKLKLLRHVDYLSTVSGGGYIGGWLAAWIRRETDGLAKPPFNDAIRGAAAVVNVERQLDPDRVVQARSQRRSSEDTDARRSDFAEDSEPSPIHHLRAHSRYLSPRVGLLSLDTWALFAIYLRNLFVNALVVLPLLAFAVLAVRSTARFYAWPESPSEGLRWSLFGAAVLFLVVAAALMAIRLSEVRSRVPKPESASWWWHPRMAVFALLISGFLAVWVAAPDAGKPISGTWDNRIPLWLVEIADGCISRALGYHVFWGLGFVVLSFAVSVLLGISTIIRRGWYEAVWLGFKFGFFRLFLAFAFGVLVEVWDDSFLFAFGTGDPRIFATFGPPSFLGIVLLAGYIEVALAGGWYSEYEREWRSRLASWMFLLAVGWVAVFAAVIYLPQLLDNRGGTATTSAVVVLTAAIRFLVPKLTAAPGMLTWVAVKVVPVIFLVALLALVASGVDRIVAQFDPDPTLDRGVIAPVAAAAGPWAESMPAGVLSGLQRPEPERLMTFGAATGGLGLASRLVTSGPDRVVIEFDPDPTQDRAAIVPVAAAAGPWAELMPSGVLSSIQPPEFARLMTFGLTSHRLYRALPPPATDWTYSARLEQSRWRAVLVATGIAGVVFFVFVLVVPVNRFSLHSMYANRLIRCYLGASQRPTKTHLEQRACVPTAVELERKANTFSGFDPDDDLPIFQLRTDFAVAMPAGQHGPPRPPKPYFGPFPIFNSTINMVAGTELAVQDRRGESFALTPYYSGSNATGFALLCGPGMPTDDALKDQMAMYWNLTVGRAVTISGAAVDPNMTQFYSPQFTAFLTIMNARLGWWIQNPRNADPKSTAWWWWNQMVAWWKEEKWGRWDAIPPFGSWHYVKELIGMTDATQSNVHLSDGGHYENTGAYELIRRRCRFVMVVDAAENPDNTSENLANLVRVVHTDFGIRIQIDTAPLRKGADGRTSEWHCAVGQIRYDDVDAGGVIGTLLFVRSSLTGDEPPDIKNYAAVTPVFPHHSTGDQFFDETMFESYRGLGYHIGMSALAEAAEALPSRDAGDRFKRRLFGKLRRSWTPCSTVQRDQYMQSCVESLREGERPKDAADDMTIVRRIQLMELEWFRNDLSHNYSHPIQRGWVNTMREWSSEVRFQEVWRRVRSEFSHEFVQFCERALNVNPPSVLVLRSGTPSYVSRWDEMRREFGQEFLSYFVAMPPVMGFRHTRNPSGYLGEIAGQFASNYWLIGYGEPTEQDGVVSDTARIQNIVGFVAVFDPILTNGTPTDASEFLLWVRGAYRMAGVGAVAMRLLFTEGAAPPLKGKKLFARFPKIGTGFAEQLQRAMWVQFMNDFDFDGVPPTGAAWEQRELRVQYLPERAG